MEKKYVKELTNEELVKVFHANEKLQNEIYDDMVESEMYHIGGQLDYLRASLSDWSIGAYNHNYIKVRDADNFIASVEKMENEYPVLVDTDLPVLQKAVEIRETYRDEEMYTDGYYELEEQLEEAAKELGDRLVERFTQILEGCSEEKYRLEYFLEFYAESRLDGECYINVEDDDFILHEDVSYTKSYK